DADRPAARRPGHPLRWHLRVHPLVERVHLRARLHDVNQHQGHPGGCRDGAGEMRRLFLGVADGRRAPGVGAGRADLLVLRRAVRRWPYRRSGKRVRRVAAYKIAVVPGDGIGKEVVPIGLAAARRALEVTGSPLATTELDWSCERYLREGSLMPADGLARLAEHDAILFGAVGSPQVPDHVSLWGLLLPIRQHFDLYVNLRPVRVLDGILSPLRHGTRETVDMLFIRENTEGEYSGVGGRFHQGSPDEVALQTAVYSRRGVERIARYAFERARERRKKVASVTKSNAIQYTAVLWDEVVRDVAER